MPNKGSKNSVDGHQQANVYLDVFQNAPDLIYMVSPEGKIIDANRTLLETLGYTLEELVDKPVWVLYSESFREKSKEVFEEWRRNGKVHAEMEVLKKNGGNLFVDLKVCSIRDDRGQIVCSVSVQRDITDHKMAERKLKESEGRLRALFNAPLNISLITTDTGPEPRILEFSRGAERIFGYSGEDVMGKPVAMLHNLEDVARFPQIQESIRQKKVGYSGKTTMVRKSGEEFPAFFTYQPFFDADGKVVASLGVAIDITEQKRTEDELRRSEELYSAIVNGSEDIIIELDFKGRIVFANSRAAKLDEGGSINLRGKPSAGLFPKMFSDELLDMTARVYELRRSLKYDSMLPHGNTRKNVLVHMVPIYGHKERVETVLISIKDTTELKLAEQVRMDNLALGEVSRLKSEFLATMSHELRTPLNAIMGYAQLLSDQVYGGLNEKQCQQVETIYASGNALLELINEILDLSRIEAGKLELAPESFALMDMVLEARSICAPMVEIKRHSLEVEVDPGLRVWADPMRFRQCLNNLLSNAIKFTPDGGQIWVRAHGNTEETATITVKDTGRGIPRDKLDAIFQPFYRVDGSSTSEFGGTGLGLTITRRLVEMMGGRIWAESEVDKGSEFHFTVPTHPTTETDTAPAEGQPAGINTTAAY